MLLTNWLSSLFSDAPYRRRNRQRPESSWISPGVELLESRKMLTIIVDTVTDEIDVNETTSLREAIALAADNPGDDTITFAEGLSGVLNLDLGQLIISDVSDRVTIEATAGVNTIDAGGSSRVLEVNSGTTATLSGLTLTGGGREHWRRHLQCRHADVDQLDGLGQRRWRDLQH